MRVTLSFAAIVRQLKMLRPFVYKRPVHRPGLEQTSQRSVNRNFIEPLSAQPSRNLFLR
jgi:hypothetical protein